MNRAVMKIEKPAKPVTSVLQLGSGLVFVMDWEKAAKLEAHSLATLFPPLSEDDMDGLVADLAANGQIHAVVLFEDKILDGVHRTKGCTKNRQDVKCVRFEDLHYQGTPSDFVLSENVQRRHMTLPQLAMIEAAVQDYNRIRAEQAAAGKLGGRGHKKTETSSANCTEGLTTTQKPAPQTREKIAKRVGVSERTAQTAIDVAKHAPELVPKVIEGSLPLEDAGVEAKKRAAAKKKAPSRPRKPRPFSLERALSTAQRRIEKLLQRVPPAKRQEFISQLVERIARCQL